MPPGPPAPPRPRRMPLDYRLLVSGLALALVMLGVGVEVIVQARRDAWSQASQAADNLRLALERDIARNLAIYDLSLVGLIEARAEPGLDAAPPGLRRHALFDRAASAEDLGALLVIDAGGNIVEDSTAVVPHAVPMADREDFRRHRDDPDAGLLVSRTYASRLVPGDLRISLSRRIPTADGHFAGIVSGGLRLAFFHRLFEKIDVGSRGSITLLRDDGVILYRYPFKPEDVGRDIGKSERFRQFAAAASGQILSESSLDGIERLCAFGHIPGLPLILSVNRATEDVYADWWRRTLTMAPVLVLLSLATAALTIIACHALRRSAEAEAAARAAVDELAALARTDALTGIGNRRAFDEALDAAWRQGRHGRAPVALLMIDVDGFKPFNDRYGHQEGDRVLRAIGRCVEAHKTRPSALAARFGGEEFAVLLPGTDLAGAVTLAEGLRAAVEALAIVHADSPGGCVTVSIGAAAREPGGGDRQASLIATADAALYAAKRGGRNRVDSAEADAAPPTRERDRRGSRILEAGW